MVMVTKLIDVGSVRPDLKKLLSQVDEGTEIIFFENETPIARLVAFRQRIAGLHSGAISVSPSFDEPLSDQFWLENS